MDELTQARQYLRARLARAQERFRTRPRWNNADIAAVAILLGTPAATDPDEPRRKAAQRDEEHPA